MKTLTPAQVAARLRILADLLDVTAAGPVPLRLYLALEVPPRYWSNLDDERRIAAVTAVANALGMAATSVKDAGRWQHKATEKGNGYTLVVDTDIDGPQVCACGEICTHNDGALAPAT